MSVEARAFQVSAAVSVITGVPVGRIVGRLKTCNFEEWTACLVTLGVLSASFRNPPKGCEMADALKWNRSVTYHRRKIWRSWPIEVRSVWRVLVDEQIARGMVIAAPTLESMAAKLKGAA